MTYQYSIIRFVPDPARGESVNVGLIVGNDESEDWELHLLSNLRRAKTLDVNGALPAALSFIGELEAHFAAVEMLPTVGAEPVSASMIELLSTEMQNVVQLSPLTPIVAESSTAAMDMLLPELLVDPTSRQFRFEKKHRAVSSTRSAYRASGVPDDAIEQRVSVRSGPFEQSFDFVVHNGHVVQLVQCWSFQLPNQIDLAEEIKAWAWVVHEIRSNGGEVAEVDARKVPLGEEVDIAAVFIPPVNRDDSPAFAEADAAFRETNTTAVEADRAEVVGKRAAALLRQP